MDKPTVYIQGANGEEAKLVVKTPDPEDGTFTCFLPEGAEWPTPEVPTEDFWLRIVPAEGN